MKNKNFTIGLVWMGVTLLCSALYAQGNKGIQHYNEPIELTTTDGWRLEGTYFNSRSENPDAGIQRPAVVLLPSDGGNRLHWEGQNGLAVRLQKKGYAVLSVDLRKYGKSKAPANSAGNAKTVRPIDYADMLRFDLEAVKQFLFEEHQKKNLNMAKTAIVAPESLSAVALGFTIRDWKKAPYNDAAAYQDRTPRGQDIRALVLISPVLALPKVPGKSALRQLRNPKIDVAVCTCVGGKDSKGMRDATHIYTALTGKSKKKNSADAVSMYYNEVYPKFGDRGTALLNRKSGLEDDMVEFLDRHLMKLSISWQDRRSRFNQ